MGWMGFDEGRVNRRCILPTDTSGVRWKGGVNQGCEQELQLLYGLHEPIFKEKKIYTVYQRQRLLFLFSQTSCGFQTVKKAAQRDKQPGVRDTVLLLTMRGMRKCQVIL